MRSGFVQVNDGGDNVFSSVSFGKKFRTFEKERADVLLTHIYKKLRACAYKERRHKNGVVFYFAFGSKFFEPLIDERDITVFRVNEMKVIRSFF